jgi:uncharacterized protein YecT (DUF1311 family)
MTNFHRLGGTLFVATAIFLATASSTIAEQIPALCSQERNQAEMTRCASDALKKADAEMAKTLQELLAATDAEDRKFVTEAQEAWSTYRDKECTARIGGSPNRGGTIWPMLSLECRAGLAALRAKDLKEQAACPGGRLDC